MIPHLTYSTSTKIYLHLEDYSNNGLSQETMIKIINNIKDPTSIGYLFAVPAGINANVSFHISTSDKIIINDLISKIEMELDLELDRINNKS